MSREAQIPAEILTAVRRYVKDRLRVSLSNTDGTLKNQDAQQLVQDVFANFIEDRDRAEDPVAYAVGIARRRVQDYFGAVKIVYTKLQDRLRYYLRNVPGFALWPDESGELLCGYAAWSGGRKARADTGTILEVKSSPEIMKLRPFPTGDIDVLDRRDWADIIEGVLTWFDKAVPFSDFTRIVCVVLQVSEYVHESIVTEGSEGEDGQRVRQFASAIPGAHRLLEAAELLSQLWLEIQSLLPRQRVAYLLNPPDDETEILINAGIATHSNVRKTIGLSPEQYRLLWAELRNETDGSSIATMVDSDEEFARLRSYLPIEDLVIAKLLVCTRNQVIGLRNCARRRLQRRMVAFRQGSVKATTAKKI